MSLSACGRRYGSRQTAANSKTAGKPGAVVTECRCGSWHIKFPDRKRTALKAVSSKRAAAPKPLAVRWNPRVTSGLKAFPRKVALLLTARDKWCQRCGNPGPLHKHHRRGKGMGGDPSSHAQCACNGLLLCAWNEKDGMGGCHRWVHLHPRQAAAEGLIVSHEVAEPGRVCVMRGTEDGDGSIGWPTCDGQWASESPWTEAAA